METPLENQLTDFEAC